MPRGGYRAKRKDLWDWKFPVRGATVVVYERVPGGNLYIRYEAPRVRGHKKTVPKSLGHKDKALARQQARELGARFVQAGKAVRLGKVTMGWLLTLYNEEISKKKTGEQPKDDARRRDMWEDYLGSDFAAEDMDTALLDDFVRDRRRGTIRSRRKLIAMPKNATIAADIFYIKDVFEWAAERKKMDGHYILSHNPLRHYTAPQPDDEQRTWATYDWYVAARPLADDVDRGGLFGFFFDFLEDSGWRSTAICHLRTTDLDLERTQFAPAGRIRMRNKGSRPVWLQMSERQRSVIDGLLAQRFGTAHRFTVQPTEAVGDQPLFPSVSSTRRDSWSNKYAYQCLQTLAKKAKLPPVSIHAWRRKKEEEDRDLPLLERLHARGRKSSRALEKSYLRRDEERIQRVLENGKKLRTGSTGGRLVVAQAG